jgi:protocatechuate 3,4-dioxygenase beta subunit
VVGPDRAPLTHFSIDLSAQRHPEGRFELPVRRNGKMELTIGAPGHAYRTMEVEAQKGQRLDLGDVQLEHGRTLRGTVLDASERPVVGALVDVCERPSGSAAD